LLTKQIIFSASLFLVGETVENDEWSGYAYSTENNGIDPLRVGAFQNLDQCKNLAKIYLKGLVSIKHGDDRVCKNGCIVDRFLCGKECVVNGTGPGSFFASELGCREKNVLESALD
jgi:hypothetical protein